MWVWIAIGLGAYLALSVLVGFALGAVFGAIRRRANELHEDEMWATRPPTRSAEEAEEHRPAGVERDESQTANRRHIRS
jgi:hypothetical protein